MGFEIAFFLYPFLQQKQKASIGIIIANTITLVLFLIITVIAFAFYSPDEITLYNEPTITLLKIVEFRFLERLEIVFFSLYLFVISTTVLPLFFTTVFSIRQLLGKQDHSKFVPWLLVLNLVYIFFYPQSFDRNTQLQKGIDPISFAFGYALPLCLWVYLWLFSRMKREDLK
jgi:hypothetical protein